MIINFIFATIFMIEKDNYTLSKPEVEGFFSQANMDSFQEIAQKRVLMTEEDLFELLCDEVGIMIETRMDYLLSLMYRLDVLEKDINEVLSPGYPEAANVGLARLILIRQKQRMATKRSYKPPVIEEDGWG